MHTPPGKTTTAQLVAEASGLRYINVGDAVKAQELHSGWDEEHQALIIDEDKVGDGAVCWLVCAAWCAVACVSACAVAWGGAGKGLQQHLCVCGSLPRAV